MFQTPDSVKFDIFYSNNASTSPSATGLYPWRVPKTAKIIHWWGLGAGAGGGGGCSGPQDTQRGGGAGGSAANSMNGFSLAIMMPDTLFIRVGRGGAGGDPDQAGTIGESTFIAYQDVSPTGVRAGANGAAAGNAGNAGTTTAGGIATNTGSTMTTWGFDFSTNNLYGTGGSGGATGTGSTFSPSANQHVTPGAGGAGTGIVYAASSGGDVNMQNLEFSSTGIRYGGLGAAGGGANGQDGYTIWGDKYPFNAVLRSAGGAGGGNANTGAGGNGGSGGIGSGGGGGGAGLTGGRGGRGGDGILIIAYW